MKLKAQPLTKAAFAPYGEYFIAEECENKAEAMAYTADTCLISLGGKDAAIGVLHADPQDAVMTQMEMHSRTEEGWLLMDGPCVAALGAPCEDPNDAVYAAFRIPAGTAVSLKAGVWHFAPIPCGAGRTTVFAVLPPHTPEEDIRILPLKEPLTIEAE